MEISAAARLEALANDKGVAEVRSHLAVEVMPTLEGRTNVILAGRATTVPFTAVSTGPQRTLTDKTTTAATCGHHHIPS